MRTLQKRRGISESLWKIPLLLFRLLVSAMPFPWINLTLVCHFSMLYFMFTIITEDIFKIFKTFWIYSWVTLSKTFWTQSKPYKDFSVWIEVIFIFTWFIFMFLFLREDVQWIWQLSPLESMLPFYIRDWFVDFCFCFWFLFLFLNLLSFFVCYAISSW